MYLGRRTFIGTLLVAVGVFQFSSAALAQSGEPDLSSGDYVSSPVETGPVIAQPSTMTLGPVDARRIAYRARDGRYLIAAKGGVEWTSLIDSPLSLYRLSHCQEDNYLTAPLYPYPLDISGCHGAELPPRRRLDRSTFRLKFDQFFLTLGPLPPVALPQIHTPTVASPFIPNLPHTLPGGIALPIGPHPMSSVVFAAPSLGQLGSPGAFVAPLPAGTSLATTGQAGTVLITHGTAHTFGTGIVAPLNVSVPPIATLPLTPGPVQMTAHFQPPGAHILPIGGGGFVPVVPPMTSVTPQIVGPGQIGSPFATPPVIGATPATPPPLAGPSGTSLATTGRAGTVVITHGTAHTFGPGLIGPTTFVSPVVSTPPTPGAGPMPNVKLPAPVGVGPIATISPPISPTGHVPMPLPPTQVSGGVAVITTPSIGVNGTSLATTGRAGTVLITHGTAYTFGTGIIAPATLARNFVVASVTSPSSGGHHPNTGTFADFTLAPTLSVAPIAPGAVASPMITTTAIALPIGSAPTFDARPRITIAGASTSGTANATFVTRQIVGAPPAPFPILSTATTYTGAGAHLSRVTTFGMRR